MGASGYAGKCLVPPNGGRASEPAENGPSALVRKQASIGNERPIRTPRRWNYPGNVNIRNSNWLLARKRPRGAAATTVIPDGHASPVTYIVPYLIKVFPSLIPMYFCLNSISLPHLSNTQQGGFYFSYHPSSLIALSRLFVLIVYFSHWLSPDDTRGNRKNNSTSVCYC